jgi:hypothetical protein
MKVWSHCVHGQQSPRSGASHVQLCSILDFTYYEQQTHLESVQFANIEARRLTPSTSHPTNFFS